MVEDAVVHETAHDLHDLHHGSAFCSSRMALSSQALPTLIHPVSDSQSLTAVEALLFRPRGGGGGKRSVGADYKWVQSEPTTNARGAAASAMAAMLPMP